jgi:hypothetical protein
MSKPLSLKMAIAAISLSLFAAACGGAESTQTAAEPTTAATTEATAEATEAQTEAQAAPAIDTPAATLTRDLTYLLGEHEYLAGAAVLTAVQAGGDLEDPTFQAAAGALDDNSVALSEAVASVYGEAGGEQFLDLWRAHIGFFVDYTLGKATDDRQMVRQASRKLNGYRADFGAFIEGATEGTLPADAVAEALDPHVTATKDAIDAVVSGDENGFEKLREAATHMPGIATALAGGIAQHQGLEGEADSGASQLQRDLTHLLVEHEYLAGFAVYMAVGAGGDLEDPGFTAAAEALDNNSVALSEAITGLYGEAGGEQFLDLWRAHIGFFVDYTLGKATDDAEMTEEAESKLDGYRSDFGAFIEGATEGTLPADAVADALDPHVTATKDAIDSVVAGDGEAFDKLRVATEHMPGIASALAGGIVQQFPDRF